jgi:hypothetical protein
VASGQVWGEEWVVAAVFEAAEAVAPDTEAAAAVKAVSEGSEVAEESSKEVGGG